MDMIIGLQFLHAQNIVHGDLKPDNVFLDSCMRANIGDFGMCLEVDPNVPFLDVYGTKGYRSPEQLYRTVPWDHRTDYFVLGIMFCEMVSVNHPFGGRTEEIEASVKALK